MTVRVTNHAVERYMERVRPGLDFDAAKTELLRLIREHGRDSARPAWISNRAAEPHAWLAIGEDVWLPCEVDGRFLVAPTVICKGGLSEKARARKNAEKLANRGARRKDQPNNFDHAVVARRRDREQKEGAWAA